MANNRDTEQRPERQASPTGRPDQQNDQQRQARPGNDRDMDRERINSPREQNASGRSSLRNEGRDER